MKKLANVLAACVLAALVITGCSDETTPNGSDDPTPTAPTTSSTPTPTTPAWQAKFTAEQLEAYDAALERWQKYTEKTNEIYRVGKDTPEARAVLREYSMQWQGDVAVLADTADRKVRIERPAKPLSWKAVSIKLNDDGTGNLIISQCTSYRDILVTQGGKPIGEAKPEHVVTALTINMSKPKGYDWMVAATDLKDKRSCAA
jgi:hypothetical protein